MAEYLVWKDHVPGHEYASVQSESGIDLLQIQAVRRGQRLDPPPLGITINTLTQGPLPDVVSSGWGGRYVSTTPKQILEKHVQLEFLQFFPAMLAPRLGATAHTLWLMNVAATAMCVDSENSDVDRSPSAARAIRTVRKLVLVPMADSAPGLLHIAELPSVLLIRSDIADALRHGVRTPGDFVPISEYRRGVV